MISGTKWKKRRKNILFSRGMNNFELNCKYTVLISYVCRSSQTIGLLAFAYMCSEETQTKNAPTHLAIYSISNFMLMVLALKLAFFSKRLCMTHWRVLLQIIYSLYFFVVNKTITQTVELCPICRNVIG